ncbi:MAG: UDP-N-acetylmuramoyl-L-alanyl-D-glutamate--2,6-diaminopimelate ligase [Oscillospiraceae bacterium]|nr:UDP-N-acetylmuramoyl-L-alanyl-D-glutamate--2,6-diaminopimelate ligase [Oscillospiraceae bacterium]
MIDWGMPLTAVIGGAGKTCTAHLVRRMLEAGTDQKLGLITTRHSYLDEKILPAPQWSNWKEALPTTLGSMKHAGCTGVIVAMTVPMLEAGLSEGLRFQTAVVTSLQDCVEAERVCAFLAGRCELLVCSVDDEEGRYLAGRWTGKRHTYAEKRQEADINGRNLRVLPDRIEFEALTIEGIARVRLPVPGGFGLYHSLAALAVGHWFGIPLPRMAAILGSAGGVAGRMELHTLPKGGGVLIDSACTPEQMENLLLTAREMVEGRLLLVCGAPGDRNRSERKPLGEVISRMADRVILTADDPRTEPVEEICRDIRAGMTGRKGTVLPDREKAIRRALQWLEPGDLLILAGRGDRDTMLVGEEEVAFDERTVLRKAGVPI